VPAAEVSSHIDLRKWEKLLGFYLPTVPVSGPSPASGKDVRPE
jgi:hypothetical protein